MDIAGLIKSLRVHGKGKTKYDNIHIGINSRLDNIQAAVLLPKLHVLDEEMYKRQKVAEQYLMILKDKIKVPFVEKQSVSSYAQFVLQAESAKQREYIQKGLKESGIPTIRYYPTPMHRLPVFDGINTYGETYLVTDRYAECSFGIPFSPYIDCEEIHRVTECILNIL